MSDNAKAIFVDQPFSRQCEVCGAVFQTTALHARYCSDKCKRQREQEIRRQKRAASGAASIGQTVACAFCGKEFVRKSQSQRYCSEQCKRAQETVVRKQKQTELKPANGVGKIFHLSIKGKCKFCGKEFEKKDIVELFCCKACEKSYNSSLGKFSRGGERRVCLECGRSFYIAKTNQKFCSFRCKALNEKKLQKIREGKSPQGENDNNIKETKHTDSLVEEDMVLTFLDTPDALKNWDMYAQWDTQTQNRYIALWRKKYGVKGSPKIRSLGQERRRQLGCEILAPQKGSDEYASRDDEALNLTQEILMKYGARENEQWWNTGHW